jgi:hypothetical protein
VCRARRRCTKTQQRRQRGQHVPAECVALAVRRVREHQRGCGGYGAPGARAARQSALAAAAGRRRHLREDTASGVCQLWQRAEQQQHITGHHHRGNRSVCGSRCLTGG